MVGVIGTGGRENYGGCYRNRGTRKLWWMLLVQNLDIFFYFVLLCMASNGPVMLPQLSSLDLYRVFIKEWQDAKRQ